MTRLRTVAVFLVMAARAPCASAQTVTATAPGAPPPPFVVMIPNYNSMLVGEIGSLQAGAYLARVQDSSATWYNPAGLAQAQASSVSGSAGAFQVLSARPDGLRGSGGSFHQLPAAVGLVVTEPLELKGWTCGFQVTRTGMWDLAAGFSREFDSAAGVDRLTYASDASFHGLIASASVGHALNGKMRIGLSLDGQLTEWEQNASAHDEYRTAFGLATVLAEGRGSASAIHLRLTGGLQYEPSPAIRLGAVVRAPGITLWTSGERYQDGVATVGSSTISSSLFEPAGEVTYRVPMEVKAGAAYVGRRAQVEVDMTAYAGAGTYPAFRSTQPLVVVRDSGVGEVVTRREYQPSAAVVDSRSVLNIAIGGQVNITANGSLRIHGGFATDRSPVGPADTQFTKVDLHSWTVGLSGNRGPVLGSLGVRYECGQSAANPVARLQNGDVYTTSIRVRNLGIVYSFAFKF